MLCVLGAAVSVLASSHREAPLISSDPLADNVDVYAFKSPDDPNTITLIATYIPFQLPQGGPNYYNFGENIRYEIHVDNDASVPGDEVTYRFTFNLTNEDPTTFFNIRLGQQNQKATYTLERSMDGGATFTTIIENGIVPPNNIGDRSIGGAAGLGADYADLWEGAITTASTGERVFAGPTDDPFFVDLGGIFDLGDSPRQDGEPRDGVACYNVSTLAIQVPISTLLKEGAPATPTNILDPDYVIGVWASSSRPAVTTLSSDAEPMYSGDWVQVSRLGMPLTNEAVIPIGYKDFWNSITPYDELAETEMDEFFYNPELALYMDDDQFGGAVPAFSPLRIQTASLGQFDFTNGADGVSALAGGDLTGTAFEAFGDLLLIPGKPRSVDLWPIFHTGVPNAIPYQLATGKEGNPVAAGKPFINNFLPNGGDMLRLNMAVPATPRDDANYSSLGLVQAAAIGLTVAPFNTTADLEFIPNMDGFPNGRRLEDDVTRIELQAVGGVVLAAVGLWYDDYDPASSPSPVTEDLVGVLGFTTGVEANDKAFRSTFPYVAMPFSGTGGCSGEVYDGPAVAGEAEVNLFVSSNTTGTVGVIGIDETRDIVLGSFNSAGQDADGIFYNPNIDALYQINRTDNRIDVYTAAKQTYDDGLSPVPAFSSTSDFTNGRELAARGNKLVVAQDASDSNGNINKFVVYTTTNDAVTYDKEYTSPVNLWGIQFVGSDLFAIEDNSSNLAIFDNFLAQTGGEATVSSSISVENMVRTHGLTVLPELDMMILTDVADGASADDGALVIVKGYTEAIADGMISADEQIRIEGTGTQLGNPVDIAYDYTNDIVFVAERAFEGGKILGFTNYEEGGAVVPSYAAAFGGASAIAFTDLEQLVFDLETVGRFYSSSNTESTVSVYDVKEDGSVEQGGFATMAMDADGIHYEWTTDLLYELDRSANTVNVYADANASIDAGQAPALVFTSTSDFTNGRELAVIDDRLIVAQDANDANGMTNKLVVYRIVGNTLEFDKEYITSFNLWGIHVEEEALYAIMDNTEKVAILEDFFNKAAGNISPDREISVDGLIRTHGITYDKRNDVMLLTDVGEATSADDGALVIIKDFANAAADNLISANEQQRIAGPATNMGNPVDVALDEDSRIIYVAERANEGGRMLGFTMDDEGDVVPVYDVLQPGAASVMFDNMKSGEVAVREVDLQKTKLALYPNPTTDILRVNVDEVFGQEDFLRYSISDMTGKVLMSNRLTNRASAIDVSGLTNGVYILSVSNAVSTQAAKFTKIR